jgi:molybdate transport system substrate-binding protein
MKTEPPLRGISSMATRALLAQLSALFEQGGGPPVSIESVGGVDAVRRVQAGEDFDLVILAADAIERLIDQGQLLPGRVDLARSGVAAAVRQGAAVPDFSSVDSLRRAVLEAPRIGYSTGPSGVALLELFKRWGVHEALAPRLLQAPAGVPVAALVARGDVALGFQQLSELIDMPGITLVGPLPAAVQITTVFSAGIGVRSRQIEAARACLSFMAGPQAVDAKRTQGMDAA